MVMNSYTYLGFLTVVVIIFWHLPNRFRGPYLLAVSIFYYATWNPYFVLLPLSLCTAAYLLARAMQRQPARRETLAWAGTGLTLLVLGFFKYREFVAHNLSVLLAGLGAHPVSLGLAIGLPLGISFYSFEVISCLVDSRQGRVALPSFLNLCNFVMFWPHLMSGPIVRVRELVPQLSFGKRFSLKLLVSGLDRLIWGLVQKNAIANTIGWWVDQGFRAGGTHSTADNWVLAIGFGLQIYFDFAGYTNMAIGAARLLGINLPENFRFPYHAASPPDFWARWHMTLSRWIRDYLFFPVNARYRGAPLPLYLSLLGIMALVGLWHGAGWGFVIWGFMHGVYLVLYRLWEGVYSAGEKAAEVQTGSVPAAAGSAANASVDARRSRTMTGPIWAVAWRVFTLVAVTAAWVPFRARQGKLAANMLYSMFFHFSWGLDFPHRFYALTGLFVALCVAEPLVARFLAWLDDAAEEKAAARGAMILARTLTYAAGLLLFMIFDQQETQFIYFQF